jgi:hypothetical protein
MDKKRFRLFIDETGTADMKCNSDPNNRFLTLTGLAFEENYYKCNVVKELISFKETHFKNPNICLHRKDIMNQNGVFSCLNDACKKSDFDKGLFELIKNLDCIVFTVGIDKKQHLEKYRIFAKEPYHYCMEVLLERYVMFLDSSNSIGDVMIEARGKKEDRILIKVYKELVNSGNKYLTAEFFKKSLTSCDLKIKPKTDNIIGLQLADLIAHPSRRHLLRTFCKVNFDKFVFGDQMHLSIIEKYYSYNGTYINTGLKMLP